MQSVLPWLLEREKQWGQDRTFPLSTVTPL
jgi:hypothetical protein